MNPYASQSKSFQRLNPHLFPGAVGAVGAAERKPDPRPALDRKPARGHKSKGAVAVVVSIITCRHRELDSDNHVAGCKALRDAIARSLAIDDGSDRVRWEYGQSHTAGTEGTIVRIEWL
jgi:hypothetical protein